MRTRDRSAARRRRGFTMIEVVVSLGIMTVGAMGIIALQQHTIRSNSHARQLTIATQIAQRWIERLKQDAATWTDPTLAPNVALANTLFLRAVVGAPPNVFITIPSPASDGILASPDGVAPQVPTRSRAFDYQGNDILTTMENPPIYYCTAFRPAWVYTGWAMRVDVRVWWPRRENDMIQTFGLCNANHTQLDPGGAVNSMFNTNAFHVVYLSTVIRPSPLLR